MNHYVILTANIHPIGGMQAYNAGKVKFLEAEGWMVHIFFSGRSNSGGCAIKSLQKYTAGWFPEISIPPGNWPAFIRNSVLQDMCGQIGDTEDKILIESQASAYALWGELLAKLLGGKHVCFICNETFRGKDRFYEEYLDFFDFKHRRKEIAGIHDTSISQLFEGYKYVSLEENAVFVAATEGLVQDVEHDAVSQIKRMDWNICYIGRIEKGYVPAILMDVRKFSDAHPEKKIQFIFVGDVKKRILLIEETFSDAKNVKLVYLGNCVPIPRMLYTKVDAVIAGSGSAIHSAWENALTVVADAENFRANGVLGIDTFNALYREDSGEQTTYDAMLEKILARGEYADKTICMQMLPPPEHYYREHFKLIKGSNKTEEYYNVLEKRKFSHKPSWIFYRCDWMIKILYRKYFPQCHGEAR